MPVSLRLLNTRLLDTRLLNTSSAGIRTLRVVVALVVSLGVTTAVSGPMAYRALEFRQAQRVALALVEPAGAEPASGAVLDAQARSDRPASVGLPPAGTAAFRMEPPTAADGATVGAGQAGGTADSNPTGDTNPITLAPAEPAPTGTTAPASTAPPDTASTASTETGTDTASTADSATTTSTASVAGPPPAITAVGAGVSETVTATTRDPLAEFNPRPSCDDKAQELNVGNQSACSAARP